MGQPVSGIRAKLNMEGVNLGTKSMNNIMQSDEKWAQNILEADRAPIGSARVLNPGNRNQNLYGGVQLGLALANKGWQTRDPTVAKAMQGWTANLNQCESFKPRNSYTPPALLQMAADYTAAACQINANMKELKQEAEVGPADIQHWAGVAAGMNDMAASLKNLHKMVCAKNDPAITNVTLDIQAQQH